MLCFLFSSRLNFFLILHTHTIKCIYTVETKITSPEKKKTTQNHTTQRNKTTTELPFVYSCFFRLQVKIACVIVAILPSFFHSHLFARLVTENRGKMQRSCASEVKKNSNWFASFLLFFFSSLYSVQFSFWIKKTIATNGLKKANKHILYSREKKTRGREKLVERERKKMRKEERQIFGKLFAIGIWLRLYHAFSRLFSDFYTKNKIHTIIKKCANVRSHRFSVCLFIGLFVCIYIYVCVLCKIWTPLWMKRIIMAFNNDCKQDVTLGTKKSEQIVCIDRFSG